MAEFVFSDASVTIDSTDLSDHVRSVGIDYSAETPESTAMGDTAKERLPGLVDWKVEIEFNQDYDADKVDAVLYPLVGAAAVAISILPTSAGVGPTNPNFNGSCLLTSYNPLGGKLGDTATAKATFTGTGALSRSTS